MQTGRQERSLAAKSEKPVVFRKIKLKPAQFSKKTSEKNFFGEIKLKNLAANK